MPPMPISSFPGTLPPSPQVSPPFPAIVSIPANVPPFTQAPPTSGPTVRPGRKTTAVKTPSLKDDEILESQLYKNLQKQLEICRGKVVSGENKLSRSEESLRIAEQHRIHLQDENQLSQHTATITTTATHIL